MASLQTERQANELLEELELIRRLMLTVSDLLPKQQLLDYEGTKRVQEWAFGDSATTDMITSGFYDTLKKANIPLEDDETYAIMLGVVKKPKSISEVVGIAPEVVYSDALGAPPAVESPTEEAGPAPAAGVAKMAYAHPTQEDFPFTKLHSKAWRAIRYQTVMEPAIMKKKIKKQEDEAIHY